MKIKILYGLEDARNASGLAVIIDVFRAFSTACYISEKNPLNLISVGDLEVAYALKKNNENYILVGERGGEILPGFDYGNSPYQVKDVDFKDKTVVLTTTAGTQGIANAQKADELITGSLVNIKAVIEYIKNSKFEDISLVCTGTLNETVLDEDAVCAQLIYNALTSGENEYNRVLKNLENSKYSRHFFDDQNKSHPKEDFYLCTEVAKFNFILKAEQKENSLIYLNKKVL